MKLIKPSAEILESSFSSKYEHSLDLNKDILDEVIDIVNGFIE